MPDELTALLKDLMGKDSDFPRKENKPIRYTSVDVVVIPKGLNGKKSSDSITFSDVIELDSEKAVRLEDGTLKVAATVTMEKIYDYGDYTALKPADELKATVPFCDGIPITRMHPPSGIVTKRDEILGRFQDPSFPDGQLMRYLYITDEDLAKDVEEKKLTDLSGDFFRRLDQTPGTFDGVNYDAMQRDIYFHYFAVVEHG